MLAVLILAGFSFWPSLYVVVGFYALFALALSAGPGEGRR